jgi:hypothetical protein
MVFISSNKDRSVYRVSSGLKDPGQWAEIYGDSESISSLAIDLDAKRLLVGESFSGVVYSLDIGERRQDTVVKGLGSVNSISIDRKRNRFYICDASRRKIWVGQLTGQGIRKPDGFYEDDELKTAYGVAVDGESNVWVSIYKPSKVVVLGPDGKQRYIFE